MCGGAILSDIIPPPRRVTDGHLWPAEKKRGKGVGGGRPRRVPEEEFEEEEFEAGFEGFEEELGEVEVGFGDEIKPSLASRNGSAGGKKELVPPSASICVALLVPSGET